MSAARLASAAVAMVAAGETSHATSLGLLLWAKMHLWASCSRVALDAAYILV
jgi:hypothetical protein